MEGSCLACHQGFVILIISRKSKISNLDLHIVGLAVDWLDQEKTIPFSRQNLTSMISSLYAGSKVLENEGSASPLPHLEPFGTFVSSSEELKVIHATA